MMMCIYLNNRYMYISLKKKKTAHENEKRRSIQEHWCLPIAVQHPGQRNCCADFRGTYCSMDINLHLYDQNHVNGS